MVSATLGAMERLPTLAELAAQAAKAPDGGWSCPKCGCRDWRVANTRESANGNLSRTRICRNCGENGPRIYTTEIPYRSADKSAEP